MYRAKLLEKIDNGKGYWNYSRMGIFKKGNEEPIGEYIRNYGSHGPDTFAAFERNDKWYALISQKYTGIHIMSLPDCKIIGGEECGGFGFCPVEIMVPIYTKLELEYKNKEEQIIKRISRCYNDDVEEDKKIFYENFALISGCVWGDDSGGWKIQVRDISKAHEGIITTLDWGYWQMPSRAKMKDLIELNHEGSYDENDPKDYVDIEFPVAKRATIGTNDLKGQLKVYGDNEY